MRDPKASDEDTARRPPRRLRSDLDDHLEDHRPAAVAVAERPDDQLAEREPEHERADRELRERVGGAEVDEHGVARPGSRKERIRAAMSRFYFRDAVNPVTPAELAAAHHHGQEAEAIEPGTEPAAIAPAETADRH